MPAAVTLIKHTAHSRQRDARGWVRCRRYGRHKLPVGHLLAPLQAIYYRALDGAKEDTLHAATSWSAVRFWIEWINLVPVGFEPTQTNV